MEASKSCKFATSMDSDPAKGECIGALPNPGVRLMCS